MNLFIPKSMNANLKTAVFRILGYDKIKEPQSMLQQVHKLWHSHKKLNCCAKTRAKELLSVINSTFE